MERRNIETLESRFCLSTGGEHVSPALHVMGQAIHEHQAEAMQQTIAALAPFARAGSVAVTGIIGDIAQHGGLVISWDTVHMDDAGKRMDGEHIRRGRLDGGSIDRRMPPGFGVPVFPPKGADGEVQTPPPESDAGPVKGGDVSQPPVTRTAEVVVNEVVSGGAFDADVVQAKPATVEVSEISAVSAVADQEVFSQSFIAEAALPVVSSAARSAIAAMSEGPFSAPAQAGGDVSTAAVLPIEAISSLATSAASRIQNVLGSTIEALAPTERVFTFAHLGSPLNFIGDSVASFVEDSATLTVTAVAGLTSTSSAGPWALTFTVLAADAILLVVIHRNRKPRIAYACTRLGE